MRPWEKLMHKVPRNIAERLLPNKSFCPKLWRVVVLAYQHRNTAMFTPWNYDDCSLSIIWLPFATFPAGFPQTSQWGIWHGRLQVALINSTSDWNWCSSSFQPMSSLHLHHTTASPTSICVLSVHPSQSHVHSPVVTSHYLHGTPYHFPLKNPWS